jgi:type II secretory pathway component PulF
LSPSAIIISPGQLSRRAELYHQLAQLTVAGLPILRSLEQIERHPPSFSFRGPLRAAMREINEGCTFTEALARTGNWIPSFDAALLEAGERSGRLDVCFRVLADYYTDRARMARQMISDLTYPVFLFHFAIFILPFADLFTGKISLLLYSLKTFGLLIPVYVGGALLIFAGQGRHGEAWRSWIERVLHPVPVLGAGRRELALARLSMALEALINAGVSIVEAWELAATVSGSPRLRRTVHAWKPSVLAGQTPAEALTASGAFPDMFDNQYHSGEVSGKLDETLKRLRQYYQEEGSRKIQMVSQWVPRFIYLGVALMIAWRVVGFYSKMFSDTNKALNF